MACESHGEATLYQWGEASLHFFLVYTFDSLPHAMCWSVMDTATYYCIRIRQTRQVNMKSSWSNAPQWKRSSRDLRWNEQAMYLEQCRTQHLQRSSIWGMDIKIGAPKIHSKVYEFHRPTAASQDEASRPSFCRLEAANGKWHWDLLGNARDIQSSIYL